MKRVWELSICPLANLDDIKVRTQIPTLHLFTTTSVQYEHYLNMKFLVSSFVSWIIILSIKNYKIS